MQRFDWTTRTWHEVPDPEPKREARQFQHNKSVPQGENLVCQSCGYGDLESLPAGSWESRHKCKRCGAPHRVIYGDAMGGTYSNTVEWNDGESRPQGGA